MTRTYEATGEAVLVPSRNRWSRVGRITGSTGKSLEDETVAAGVVVALKRGNARGAKDALLHMIPQSIRKVGVR